MDFAMENRICFLLTAAVCSIFCATNAGSSADTYLGCYNEHGAEAVFTTSNRPTFHRLTPDRCRETCRKDLIYSFAGLWAGTHCYCASGLNEDSIQQINNSLCYLYCPAEPAEFCGGPNASYIFSVYSVCSRGLYGRNCANKCNCKDNRSCSVGGICPGNECAAGWKLNVLIANRWRCSIDIDECTTNTRFCEDKCINVDGGYHCACQSGYKLHYDLHSCVDANECQTPCSSLNVTMNCHLCKEPYECQNTIGSYTCTCKNGFSINPQQDACEDIDECSEKQTTNCSHTCTNTIGSYECGCLEGFKLEDEGHRCVGLVEERGWLWQLVVGLGLGIGILVIVVLALIIAVCKLRVRRRLETVTATANYTAETEMQRRECLNTTDSKPNKFFKTQPDEPEDVYAEIA